MPLRDRLDPDKIKANLDGAYVGRKVVVFNSTASTNDIAAEYSRDKSNNGMAIFAESQTTGRGRSGNKWHSGQSDSIICSVLLTDCALTPELLCLAAAVAVAETIAESARIKWPNDILLNNRKVAGILLESRIHDYGAAYIIGIGINCHQQENAFPEEIKSTATSIDIETRTTCSRISLARRLLVCLDHQLKNAEIDSEKIIEQWRQRSIQLGHRVTLAFNGRKFTGNCIGIDPQKGLVLQLDTGAVRFFHAAHTTVAKQEYPG
ncbi:MAG: biotin--[acetyl-CoA-carboxylase] ligase [Sedimentisphaerales bacterium]|nr:biotin--[acetyl-CoA-carboxylase] ligase [Sedimentisphaerales bacterium]